MPPKKVCVASAIRRRAAQVRHPGAWIGFFEWLVWSELRQVDVHILFGSASVDLRAVFGVHLPHFVDASATHRTAAVLLKNGEWRTSAPTGSALPTANHFVIGVPIAGRALVAPLEEVPSGQAKLGSARVFAAKAGWALKETDATGDCGPDTMAYHGKLARSPATWLTIRRELAAFMDERCCDEAWQNTFRLCQEASGPSGGEHSSPPITVGGMGPPAAVATAPLAPVASSQSPPGAFTGKPSANSPSVPHAAGGGVQPQGAPASSAEPAVAFMGPWLAPSAVTGPPKNIASPTGGALSSQAPLLAESSAVVSKLHPPAAPPPAGIAIPCASSCAAPSALAAASCQLVVSPPCFALAAPESRPPPEASAPMPGAIVEAAAPVAEAPSDTGAARRQTFIDFLNALPTDRRREITKDYSSYKAAEDVWAASLPPQAVHPEQRPQRRHTSSRLAYRRAVGSNFARWVAGPGAGSAAPLKDNPDITTTCTPPTDPPNHRSQRLRMVWSCLFCVLASCCPPPSWLVGGVGWGGERDGMRVFLFVSEDFLLTLRVYSGPVPKQDRVWLASCRKLAAGEAAAQTELSSHKQGGARASVATSKTPNTALMRRRLAQGPPYKCPLIRELLWDWFVDMRASVKGTLSPKFVLLKAREIATTILRAQRGHGKFILMPRLDKKWLYRWKRDKGVVFRKPNCRYKCSKAVLLRRLRAMWLNVIRVRRFAERLWHIDLAPRIFGIDEKPVHFNEAGSKNVRTLEISGAPEVVLKQNHAATRERVSVMTTVCSCPDVSSQPRLLPVEVLFKATSAKRTAKLEVPANRNVSVAWAEKGSYRAAHLMRFLERWLDPWTEERARTHDYRILFLDVATSHIGDEIRDFAWSRGYIVQYHYGCTTGVAQVNDTDCHGDFEREYLEFEQSQFNHRQLFEPWCVNRTPQEVLDDVVATWAVLDHTRSASGHKRNGLSNALDGSEDHLINRGALECWRELDMASERRAAIAEVDALFSSGEEVSAGGWRALVRHPEDPGVLTLEGAELEGALVAGEALWETEADLQAAEKDDAECLHGPGPAEKRAAESSCALGAGEEVVVTAPGDDPADIEEALVATKRLAKLRTLQRDLAAARVPAATFLVAKEVSQLERGLRAKGPAEKRANAVLRRTVEKRVADEAVVLRRKRAVAKKKAHNLRVVKATLAKAKALKKKAAAAKAAVKAKLAALPKTFSAKDCDEAGAAGRAAREACLERLKLRSPKLAFEAEANWDKIKKAYAKAYPNIVGKKAVGHTFIKQIDRVLERLVEHCSSETAYNKGGKTGGDPEAFAKFVARLSKDVPKLADVVVF